MQEPNAILIFMQLTNSSCPSLWFSQIRTSTRISKTPNLESEATLEINSFIGRLFSRKFILFLILCREYTLEELQTTLQTTMKEKFSTAPTECYPEHWAQMHSERGRSGGPEDVPGKREMSFKMVGTFGISSTLFCLLLQLQVLTAFQLHAHVLVGPSGLLACVQLSLAPTTCHNFLRIIKNSFHWSGVSVTAKLDCLDTNPFYHSTFCGSEDSFHGSTCHPTSLIIYHPTKHGYL